MAKLRVGSGRIDWVCVEYVGIRERRVEEGGITSASKDRWKWGRKHVKVVVDLGELGSIIAE